MTGKPIRHFTVVQSKNEVISRLDKARDEISEATLDLTPLDGTKPLVDETLPIRFSVRQALHEPDGSHLYVGITDLDVVINIAIGTDCKVTARLL